MLAGRLPNLIPDVRADDRAASLPITEAADIGAFASVPLTWSSSTPAGSIARTPENLRRASTTTSTARSQSYARMFAKRAKAYRAMDYAIDSG